jgi:heme O synthase-like polyprenyltransferase
MNKATEQPWWVLPSLGIAVLTLYGLALTLAYFKDTTLFTAMAGGASGMAVSVIGYYFGSSASSAKKDSTIAAAAGAGPTGATSP